MRSVAYFIISIFALSCAIAAVNIDKYDLYCFNGGNCTLNNLIVTGNTSNLTINDITLNVTQSITLNNTEIKDWNEIGNNLNYIDPINYIQLNTSWSNGHSEGRLHWNSEDATMEIGMAGPDVNLQVGQEILLRTKNNDLVDIPNCKVVFLSGASGSKPEVQIVGTEDPFRVGQATIGLTTEDIEQNQLGYVTTYGLVRDCNTLEFSEGSALYLGYNGTFTDTPAIAPNASIFIGLVLRSHLTEGIIFVQLDKQSLLGDLSDVYTASLNNYDILQYDSTDLRYENTNTPTFNHLTSLDNIFYNVTKEVSLEPSSFKLAGSNPADSIAIGAFSALAFDKTTTEYAYSSVHVPPDYSNETDWQIQIYWSANDATNDQVSWCVDYAMAREEQGYINSVPSTVCVNDTNQADPYLLLETSRINVSGIGVYRDDNFGFKVYRDTSQDNLTTDALLVEISVYYNSDRLGYSI